MFFGSGLGNVLQVERGWGRGLEGPFMLRRCTDTGNYLPSFCHLDVAAGCARKLGAPSTPTRTFAKSNSDNKGRHTSPGCHTDQQRHSYPLAASPSNAGAHETFQLQRWLLGASATQSFVTWTRYVSQWPNSSRIRRRLSEKGRSKKLDGSLMKT